MVSRETAGPVPDPPDLPDWLTPFRAELTAFVALLAADGVTRGLIGPREVPRLWDRHILNCAVVADPSVGLVAPAVRVVDVGSGAGLPGLVWAVVRPDVEIVLVEPLLRRSVFLAEAVAAMDLGARVTVWRARAEEASTDAAFHRGDVVTARAVAPLARLVGWTVPLLRPGGRLVALKGSSAADEVLAAAVESERVGLVDVVVREVGGGVVDPPTTVITGVRRTAE